MNYQTKRDATLLHLVDHQVMILSSMMNEFVRAMSSLVRSLTHSFTTARVEKKSQQFLPMISGVITLEDGQRERVVEWAKTRCQFVLLHSTEGGFTSSLSYMVNVIDIIAHTARKQQKQRKLHLSVSTKYYSKLIILMYNFISLCSKSR